MAQVDFSVPHRNLPSVFVVKDYRKDAFESRASLDKVNNLRIAVLKGTRRFEVARKEFPLATIVPLEKIEDYFVLGEKLADASLNGVAMSGVALPTE